MILGLGITGRIAYSILEKTKHTIQIIGDKISYPNGLFYVHEYLPKITNDNCIQIHYRVNGTRDVDRYLRKTRRNVLSIEDTSFPANDYEAVGYQLSESFWRSGNTRTARVISIDLSSNIVEFDNNESYIYDYLISSIPLPVFAKIANIQLQRDFVYNSIYVYNELLSKNFNKYQTIREITVYYDTTDNEYYRKNIYNSGAFKSYEYTSLTCSNPPEGSIENKYGKIESYGNIEEICNQLPHNVLLAGRYATWQPREMAHMTYRNILSYCQNNNLV